MEKYNGIHMKVRTEDLSVGMVVAKNVTDKQGHVLVTEGRKLTLSFLKRIQKMGIQYVYVYLTDYLKIQNSKDRYIDDFHKEEKEKENKNKRSAINIHNTFFLQISNLILSCGKRILRLDTDLVLIQKTILNAICNKEMLNMIMNLKVKAQYLLEHSVEVAILSTVIARKMNMEDEKIRDLILAAFLHDIGMLEIPEDILFKKEPLSAAEAQIIKSHAVKSIEYLKKNAKINDNIRNIILQHHERFNGTGYPNGLVQENISVYAQILSACDVYSALASDRSYRNKVNPQERIEYFRGSGGYYFDYEIVKILLDSVSIYFNGQWVKLNTGEVGIIVGIEQEFSTRPYVRILYDKHGNRVDEYEIFLGDRKNTTVFIERIL
jgi:putative nucleotidyltransferase with HDIG domain